MAISKERLRRFTERDYKPSEQWQMNTDAHDIALEYIKLHVPTVTKCVKCGKSTEENKSKYCGDGSDKDNVHSWKRFVIETEKDTPA